MIKLFSFRGRTSRLGFWRMQLLASVVSSVAVAIGYSAIIQFGQLGGVFLLALPPLLAMSLATGLRRLHDRGKNVVWLLVFTFGPLACLAIAQSLVSLGSIGPKLASLPFSLGGIGLVVWGWIEFGFLRGQAGANQFGEPPPTRAIAP